jgi:glycosyltransferase involved in cell wall biosynthesis
VRYAGEVPHASVAATLQNHHALLLPTVTENYGHVIAEALTAGCICVISDQTPWRDLQKLGVGWDIPLHDIQGFASALQKIVDMDQPTFLERSLRAQEFAQDVTRNDEPIEQHRRLFTLAISSGANLAVSGSRRRLNSTGTGTAS